MAPPFACQPHFVEGARYPLAKDAQRTPPVECAFEIGDSVTYTNDQGVSFANKLVTGFSSTVEYGRFVYLDSDSWWFPVQPASLTHTESVIERQISRPRGG